MNKHEVNIFNGIAMSHSWNIDENKNTMKTVWNVVNPIFIKGMNKCLISHLYITTLKLCQNRVTESEFL